MSGFVTGDFNEFGEYVVECMEMGFGCVRCVVVNGEGGRC